MSVIDRFFEKHEIIVRVEIISENVNSLSLDENSLIKVSKTGNKNCIHCEFNHKDMDGVAFIQEILKDFEIPFQASSVNCFSCVVPLCFFSKMFHHAKFSFIKPFLQYPNTKLHCVQKSYMLDFLKDKYKTIQKNHVPDLKFSTFLCSIPCFLYHQETLAKYIKLQIVHYIPMIEGNNKIFPDNILLELKTLSTNEKNLSSFDNFLKILKEIHAKRKSMLEIYQIYQYYRFFGSCASIPSNIIPVDISFSTISIPLDYENFQFLSKSRQFEKCSMFAISNKKGKLSMCFSIDKTLLQLVEQVDSVVEIL